MKLKTTFHKTLLASVFSVGSLMLPDAYVVYAQSYNYTPSYVGGSYGTSGTYSPSYAGGSYGTSNTYTPSYVGGSYGNSYNYTPSYVGGSYGTSGTYSPSYAGGSYGTSNTYTPSYVGGSYGNSYNYTPSYTPGNYGYSYNSTPYYYNYGYTGGNYGYSFNTTPSNYDYTYTPSNYEYSVSTTTNNYNYTYTPGNYGYSQSTTTNGYTYTYTPGNYEYSQNPTPNPYSYNYTPGNYGYSQNPTPNNYSYNYQRGNYRYDYDYDYDNRGGSVPRCIITISDTHITPGQLITLSWTNERTDRTVLVDSYGQKIFDTRYDRDINKDWGVVSARPTQPTEYIMTVYRGSKVRTCTVGAVIENITVVAARWQGGIDLGQVPYTGFEAGPTLTFIFYTAIVLWGFVIAYVLVIRRRDRNEVVGEPLFTEKMFSNFSDIEASATNIDESEIFISDISSPPVDLPTVEEDTLSYLPQFEDSLKELEQHAHDKYALLSSDALAYVQSLGVTQEEQITKLSEIIEKAKGQFPKEGDWIVINKERIISVLG